MSNRTRWSPILVMLVAAQAAAADSSFLQDAVKARAIIAQTVAAAGGRAAIEGLERLQYRSAGFSRNLLQSFDPHVAPPAEPLRSSFVLDFKNDRYYQSIDITIAGVNAVPAPTFFKDGQIFTLDDFQKEYAVVRSATPGLSFDGPSRYVPVLVLKRLLKNARSATWARDCVVHDRPCDEIEFSWDESTRYRLDIDKSDHSMLALHVLATDPIAGDDEVRIEYSGRQSSGAIAFPQRATSFRRGEKALDFTLIDIKVNEPVEAARFEVPSGYAEVPSKPVVTERIAENLYEVRELGGGAYRSQFVDAGDSVVVFEALLSNAVSQQVISEIRKTLGDKPIRYVVLSHFHNDHAAGAGAFVAIGATIVTTAGNEDILTRYVRASRPELRPDFLDVAADKLEIAGGHHLTVYRIPNVPHVREMLALYDPGSRTIMDADLFATFFPFSPSFQRFADWLRSASAPDVAMIAGVHHPPMTKKAFLDLAQPSA